MEHATMCETESDASSYQAPGDGTGVTYNIYNAPVNHIGQSLNANLGVNHGSIQQKNQSVPPTLSAEVTSDDLLPRPFPIPPVDLFSLLNPILDASHTRNLKFSPPNSRCFPGTRKVVIEMVLSWAGRSLSPTSPHIMWIYGYAGCGKSAIAQEVAKRFAEHNCLAASFFFFRGSQDRSRVARFAGTIVSQIAAALPAAVPIIEAAVRGNPGLLSIGTTSLSSQFESLVYRPTLSLHWDLSPDAAHKPPFIIVLDGLDECEDYEEVATFIEDMITFFDQHPLIPLRFLITSRVGEHIRRELHSSAQVTLLNLVQHTSDEDISAALDVSFAKEKHSRVLESDETWPDSDDKQRLVRHIGGSFIVMTTILRALFDRTDQDGLTPTERLPLLLRTRLDFDGLYKEILAGCQHLPYFFDIISMLARGYRAFSISELAELLETRPMNIVHVLVRLHAVMHVPDDDRTPIAFWHTSLGDFLRSPISGGSFFTTHQALAIGCVSLLAARSVQSAAYEYSQRFAMNHLVAFVEGLDEPEHAHKTLGRIASHLNQPLFEWRGPACRSALEVASRSQDWNLVRALGDAGVEVNAHFHGTENGIVAPLHAACHYEGMDAVTSLLKNGANPNIPAPAVKNPGIWGRYSLPLIFAADRGDADLVKQLLECGADPNLRGGIYGTAIRAACLRDSLGTINLLLKQGADPSLRGGDDDSSALHTACLMGDDVLVLKFLEYSANPNITDEYGDTPLHNACSRGHVKTAEYLLDFNALLEAQNERGNTALHDACTGGHANVVKCLLQSNADPCARNLLGDTPLHHACRRGDVQLVKDCLSKLDGNPSVINKHGSTPLHDACYYGHVEVAECLLRLKIDPNIRNSDGRTALDVGREEMGEESTIVQMFYRQNIVE